MEVYHTCSVFFLTANEALLLQDFVVFGSRWLCWTCWSRSGVVCVHVLGHLTSNGHFSTFYFSSIPYIWACLVGSKEVVVLKQSDFPLSPSLSRICNWFGTGIGIEYYRILINHMSLFNLVDWWGVSGRGGSGRMPGFAKIRRYRPSIGTWSWYRILHRTRQM
jgi:hypothetical protein